MEIRQYFEWMLNIAKNTYVEEALMLLRAVYTTAVVQSLRALSLNAEDWMLES